MKTTVIHQSVLPVSNVTRHSGFLIPKGRLVKVVYWKDGQSYSRNIANPETNSRLQQALLALGISISQVSSVEMVKEIAPNSANSENYVETFLSRVKSNEINF